MGDLFFTKSNDHNRPPVVGFFEHMDGSFQISKVGSITAFFTSIEEGSVGIYFRKNVHNIRSGYWARFHEVWINGKLCVIHEQFIQPLVKGVKDE